MVLLASPVSVAPARVHPTSRAAGYSLVSTPSYYSYDSDDMHKKYGGWPCEELFTAEVPRPCAPRRKSHLPSFSDQILVSQSVDVCPFDASRFSKSRGVAGSALPSAMVEYLPELTFTHHVTPPSLSFAFLTSKGVSRRLIHPRLGLHFPYPNPRPRAHLAAILVDPPAPSTPPRVVLSSPCRARTAPAPSPPPLPVWVSVAPTLLMRPLPPSRHPSRAACLAISGSTAASAPPPSS